MTTTAPKPGRKKEGRTLRTRRMVRENTLGEEIIEGLREAIAYERGEVTGLRLLEPVSARDVKVRPAPEYTGEEVAAVRARLNLSQAVFALVLNVSPETVRAWEQEKRSPDGAALRLLEIAEHRPDLLLGATAIEVKSRIRKKVFGKVAEK
ncbi:MAG: helix-turn-helix domain-containing protein [Gemmatimonadaceae bacterium]